VPLIRRVPPRVRAALLLAIAVVIAGLELAAVLSPTAVGLDFVPLRHAAQALPHGRSIFGDPTFVYPPTAAVVLLPTALGSEPTAFRWWVLAGAAALGFSAWMISRTAPPGRRLLFAGVAVLTLLGSSVAHRSLFLGNMSELLVPLAVGALVAFDRGRWTLGCALLAVSLLLKPLLLPLLAVPVLRRRWTDLIRTMVPAVLLLAAAVRYVPGGRQFPVVLRYCFGGTDLHGANAVNNLSLRGWAEGQHGSHVLALIGSAMVVLLIACRIRAVPHTGERPSAAWLGSVLLIGAFLAGSISEVHFLLVAMATTLLHLASRPRFWGAFVPGLVVLGLPAAYTSMFSTSAGAQNWLVAGELLLLTALLLPPVPGRRPAGIPDLVLAA
jgi:hypothetical protein